MIRLAKVAVIAALPAFALIVAYNNVFKLPVRAACIEYGYDIS